MPGQVLAAARGVSFGRGGTPILERVDLAVHARELVSLSVGSSRFCGPSQRAPHSLSLSRRHRPLPIPPSRRR